MTTIERFLENPELQHVVEDDTMIKLSIVIIGSGLILMLINQLIIKKLG